MDIDSKSLKSFAHLQRLTKAVRSTITKKTSNLAFSKMKPYKSKHCHQ